MVTVGGTGNETGGGSVGGAGGASVGGAGAEVVSRVTYCLGNNTGDCDQTREYCTNMTVSAANGGRLIGTCACLAPYHGIAGSCTTGEM